MVARPMLWAATVWGEPGTQNLPKL